MTIRLTVSVVARHARAASRPSGLSQINTNSCSAIVTLAIGLFRSWTRNSVSASFCAPSRSCSSRSRCAVAVRPRSARSRA